MAPTYHDFENVYIQAIVFTPGGQVATQRLLKNLLERWQNEFDGNPISLPQFADAPAVFPRIILNSSSDQLQLEISAASASVKWTETKQRLPNIGEALTLSIEILRYYLDTAPAKAGRLGFVTRRVVPDETPAKTLARHFCQERWLEAPFNRPENFELHAHKQFQMSEFTVNSWVRCKNGVRTIPLTEGKPPESQSVLLVEQDINTLAEIAEEKVFSYEEMQRFFSTASEEVDKILRLYFPGD